jgi:hypothetical protein
MPKKLYPTLIVKFNGEQLKFVFLTLRAARNAARILTIPAFARME